MPHCSPDNPGMVSHASITVHVLDVNDNSPVIAGGDSVILCESSTAGQVGGQLDSDWTLKTRMQYMTVVIRNHVRGETREENTLSLLASAGGSDHPGCRPGQLGKREVFLPPPCRGSSQPRFHLEAQRRCDSVRFVIGGSLV